MAEFAFAMVAVLEGINRDCFNDFKLRVGMCNGPVVAGNEIILIFMLMIGFKSLQLIKSILTIFFQVLLVRKSLNMIFGVIQ